MFRLDEPLGESEVGVREARTQFPDLLSIAESGSRVIHITRRGKRVAALVSSDVAEDLVAVHGKEGVVLPGDVATAIKVVEGFLVDDEARAPDVAGRTGGRHAVVGGCMSLVDVMLSGPALGHGELGVESASGRVDTKFVADILVRKLYRRADVRAIAVNEFPLVAGSLWAAQVQGSAIEYRLGIPEAVSVAEGFVWVFALFELCRMINIIHGDGTAEALMYEIEERFREDYREFEVRPDTRPE